MTSILNRPVWSPVFRIESNGRPLFLNYFSSCINCASTCHQGGGGKQYLSHLKIVSPNSVLLETAIPCPLHIGFYVYSRWAFTRQVVEQKRAVLPLDCFGLRTRQTLLFTPLTSLCLQHFMSSGSHQWWVLPKSSRRLAALQIQNNEEVAANDVRNAAMLQQRIEDARAPLKEGEALDLQYFLQWLQRWLQSNYELSQLNIHNHLMN